MDPKCCLAFSVDFSSAFKRNKDKIDEDKELYF